MNTQRRLTFLLQIVLVLSLLDHGTQAQTVSPSSSTENTRITRLAGLAQVWGTVKYFHPYLAYRDIDWDKALIETIPKVNSAKTAQDYEAAINQMLAVLNDKSTRAEVEVKAGTTPAAASQPVRTENGQLIIDATHIARAVAKDISTLNSFTTSINQALPNSSAVIFDVRSATKVDELETYHLDNFLRQTLTAMLDANVVLGATRYRMHNGYAAQNSGGSNFYYSAFVTSTPKTLAGRAKTKTPPIAFVINEHTPSFTDVLGGLRSAGRALVVLEGEQPAVETFTIELPEGVKVRMRTAELINADGSIGLQPDVTVAKATTGDAALKEGIKAVRETTLVAKPKRGAPTTFSDIEYDKSYTEMTFPNAEYRLLALFRYWNVINLFFPYKHLIGDSWQTVLARYIPKFEANKDVTDYQLTVRELVTEMHDSHGGVRNANAASEKLGMFLPPLMTGYVEGKSVVTKVLNDKLPVKVGDVILAVDGEAIEKKREFLSRYSSASTPQWLMRGVNARVLFGAKDSVVKVKVQDASGAIREVEMTRSQSVMDPKWQALLERTAPVMQVLPSGFGYADLDRLQVGEVDKMFETIKDTPAVILDMRGYPNGTAWSIAPRLTDKNGVVAAQFSRPLLEATNLSNTELADSARYSFSQRIPDRQGDVYRGKVVVLINEDAISQAEHTCMFLKRRLT